MHSPTPNSDNHYEVRRRTLGNAFYYYSRLLQLSAICLWLLSLLGADDCPDLSQVVVVALHLFNRCRWSDGGMGGRFWLQMVPFWSEG